MAEAKKITAVNIKKLLYGETSEISADLTGQALYTLLQGDTLKEVKNIHGDTWTLEEAEASRTNYKNQLTGQTYRSDKEMGDVTVNFTIGEYDYPTKKDLMGGDVINTDKGWKRARGKVKIEKLIVALTEDDQYCVIPRADIGAREATTDKAIGLPVSAVELEPKDSAIAPEYWFDSEEVKAGV
ncbi:hypothetical protein [uncultured Bacteroides sp.]|jgi:hypothetical protein|uniref:hypothetical protein n=1 Tax=uncultured Bacteroides sp. TaxID=162156 RepID=UPI00280A8614|nr:hypothetical protein [uncultured Bacteroides sp.]